VGLFFGAILKFNDFTWLAGGFSVVKTIYWRHLAETNEQHSRDRIRIRTAASLKMVRQNSGAKAGLQPSSKAFSLPPVFD